MDEDEKMQRIPQLKEAGNSLYKEKKYEEAAEKYAEAIGMLENLLLRWVITSDISFNTTWCSLTL